MNEAGASVNSGSEKWRNRIDFLALASWLSISIGLAIMSFVWFGVDFRGYYAAARVFITGGNPYDYHQVARVLLQVTGRMGNNPYYYPPWFVWLFLLVVFLPFQLARAVWMAFNLVIWDIGLWKLSELLDWPRKGWRRYSIFLLSTLTFAWITWRYEQAGILVFALLVAVIISIRNEEWVLSGLLLALLLIKPNVTLVVVMAVGLWLLKNRHWRVIGGLLVSLLLLLTASTLMTPGWYRPLFEPGFAQGLTHALDGPNRIMQARINTTLLDWLATLSIGGQTRYILYGLSLLGGIILLFFTIRDSESLLQVTSVSLLVSYATTPYAMQYDYPPLVIVLFYALSLCRSARKTRSAGLLLAGFVFSVSVWQRNIAWGFWIVVGLLVLQAWGLYQATLKGNEIRMPEPDS